MKAITIIFYILVLVILSIGVYFHTANTRYTYQHDGHIRVDGFTGKVQYYDDSSGTWGDGK